MPPKAPRIPPTRFAPNATTAQPKAATGRGSCVPPSTRYSPEGIAQAKSQPGTSARSTAPPPTRYDPGKVSQAMAQPPSSPCQHTPPPTRYGSTAALQRMQTLPQFPVGGMGPPRKPGGGGDKKPPGKPILGGKLVIKKPKPAYFNCLHYAVAQLLIGIVDIRQWMTETFWTDHARDVMIWVQQGAARPYRLELAQGFTVYLSYVPIGQGGDIPQGVAVVGRYESDTGRMIREDRAILSDPTLADQHANSRERLAEQLERFMGDAPVECHYFYSGEAGCSGVMSRIHHDVRPVDVGPGGFMERSSFAQGGPEGTQALPGVIFGALRLHRVVRDAMTQTEE